jgi:surfeit locus 1 family protein
MQSPARSIVAELTVERRQRPSPIWRLIRRIATLVLIFSSLALLLTLGTWQVHRLHWKETLLADIADRRAMPPVGVEKLGAILASGGPIEYRPVNVTGTFDHAKEQDFFATFNGESGYFIYTPMKLISGEYLFVNRGFVPFDRKEAATRPAGEVGGIVTITGLARERLPAKPSWFVPDNDTAKNIFYWKDLEAMTRRAGLDKSRVLQFFVDANDAPNPGGLPMGGVTQFDFPNNHLQYAVTWYGLAAALAVISTVYWFRNRKKKE